MLGFVLYGCQDAVVALTLFNLDDSQSTSSSLIRLIAAEHISGPPHRFIAISRLTLPVLDKFVDLPLHQLQSHRRKARTPDILFMFCHLPRCKVAQYKISRTGSTLSNKRHGPMRVLLPWPMKCTNHWGDRNLTRAQDIPTN